MKMPEKRDLVEGGLAVALAVAVFLIAYSGVIKIKDAVNSSPIFASDVTLGDGAGGVVLITNATTTIAQLATPKLTVVTITANGHVIALARPDGLVFVDWDFVDNHISGAWSWAKGIAAILQAIRTGESEDLISGKPVFRDVCQKNGSEFTHQLDGGCHGEDAP